MRRSNRGQRDNASSSGRLRIVAGKWRSRLLPVADEPGLRPTPERIRETLFNWLAPTIEGKRCLDLFAGSGALGFEALSRGATSVDFVERSAKAAEVIRQSIATLAADGAQLRTADATVYLQKKPEMAFDLVFLDPPFASDLLAELCRLLDMNSWLAPGAHVYLELKRDSTLPELPNGWTVWREKTAGEVRFALLSAE